jgi:FAD:protein FMN transferase
MLLLTALLAISTQVPEGKAYEFREVHMGMPVRMVLHAASEGVARTAARAAFARIAELDTDLNDYRPGSELRRLERSPGSWITIRPTTFAVVARALEIARLTKGAFDPTIGPLVGLWRIARRTQELPARTALDSAKTLVSYELLELDSTRCAARLLRPGMRLDLGGIAKGYILGQALGTLAQHGAPAALLEAGGDIVVGQRPPGRSGWHIETPFGDSAVSARAASLEHTAIATSGPSAQFVEIGGVRYSHVIDPRTGLGLTNRLSAHVIARDPATADALATALTIVGPARAHKLLAAFPGATGSIKPTHER